MQDIVEKSKQKSELLRYYSDSVPCIENLEGRLKEVEEHSLRLQEKLDDKAAKYFKEKKALEDAKDALVADNSNLLAQKNELLKKNTKLQHRKNGEYS